LKSLMFWASISVLSSDGLDETAPTNKRPLAGNSLAKEKDPINNNADVIDKNDFI